MIPVRKREANSVDWAITTMSLADAHLLRGPQAGDVDRAIEFYEEALHVITRVRMPVDWATLTEHLVAFRLHSALRRDDKDCFLYGAKKREKLERAIALHERVFEVRTRKRCR
jgi:hypothetical protein